MVMYNCTRGCCNLEVKSYKEIQNEQFYRNKSRCKAGAFIYNPHEGRVLLVQSRGNFWGSPKGTLEKNEGYPQCAIREIKEETGIVVNLNQLERSTIVKGKSVYYYIESDVVPVTVQNDNDDNNDNNDANAISWIKIKCLQELIKLKAIKLNKHTIILFKRFLDINILQ